MFRGRHKFNARKTMVGHDVFDSQAEADRFQVLKLMQVAGKISGLERQPKFTLQPAFVYEGQKIRAVVYRADFLYTEAGRIIVEDVKGYPTETAKLKMKLFKFHHAGLHLRIVKNGRIQGEILQPVWEGGICGDGRRCRKVLTLPSADIVARARRRGRVWFR